MKFKSLSDLLKDSSFDTLKNSSHSSSRVFSDDTFDFLSLIENWHLIIGEKFAKFSIPLKLQYGTLTILSNHSVFAQHLGFLEETIKVKIVEHYPALKGKINSIKFQNNPRHFQDQVNSHASRVKSKIDENEVLIHKQSPRYKELERKAKEVFSDLEEDEIKDQIISIYIQKHYFNA